MDSVSVGGVRAAMGSVREHQAQCTCLREGDFRGRKGSARDGGVRGHQARCTGARGLKCVGAREGVCARKGWCTWVRVTV